MQLPKPTFIAGSKTVRDWISLRTKLENLTDNESWEIAYSDFLLERLNRRYFNPINLIRAGDTNSGEGFSIMSIMCSLIEFLETTYKGLNYRYLRHGDPPLSQYEYSISKDVFISFLTTQRPFSSQFTTDLAKDFYSSVRCGLLHEARTNGKWTIWNKVGNDDILIEEVDGETILYRDNFYTGIKHFVSIEYKAELLSSNERKEAFLRKFDKLCEM